jgi:hypothetical protein
MMAPPTSWTTVLVVLLRTKYKRFQRPQSGVNAKETLAQSDEAGNMKN